jgi:hypothetical protein
MFEHVAGIALQRTAFWGFITPHQAAQNSQSTRWVSQKTRRSPWASRLLSPHPTRMWVWATSHWQRLAVAALSDGPSSRHSEVFLPDMCSLWPSAGVLALDSSSALAASCQKQAHYRSSSGTCFGVSCSCGLVTYASPRCAHICLSEEQSLNLHLDLSIQPSGLQWGGHISLLGPCWYGFLDGLCPDVPIN